MQCPACDRELQERTVGGLTVDVCDGGCAGVWFDQHELRKVDEPHEGAGEALLDLTRNPGVKVRPEERRRCPRCADSVMMRHFFSVKRHVEVDECPTCAGFWLDCGELRDIRALYATEEERRRAAEEYFDEVFGEEVKERLREGDEGVKRARRFAQTFRFICPSYYIPGKQDWGAF